MAPQPSLDAPLGSSKHATALSPSPMALGSSQHVTTPSSQPMIAPSESPKLPVSSLLVSLTKLV